MLIKDICELCNDYPIGALVEVSIKDCIISTGTITSYQIFSDGYAICVSDYIESACGEYLPSKYNIRLLSDKEIFDLKMKRRNSYLLEKDKDWFSHKCFREHYTNDNKEIVYFELDDWTANVDYPDEEPFISYVSDQGPMLFNNDQWCKDNKICINVDVIDMSAHFTITALKEWVDQNCPKLLTNYTKFLRYPYYEDDDVLTCNEGFGTIDFLEYKEENFGSHFIEDEFDKDSNIKDYGEE